MCIDCALSITVAVFVCSSIGGCWHAIIYLFYLLFLLFKGSRILLSGDHSERNALVEVEGNFIDDSVCDRYLAQAAEVFASECMKGIIRNAVVFFFMV